MERPHSVASVTTLAQAKVLADVARERDRQTDLVANGRIPWDCADPRVPNERKLAVLAEEFGEVARALLEEPWNLGVELVQVAAVAVAWAEAVAEVGTRAA